MMAAACEGAEVATAAATPRTRVARAVEKTPAAPTCSAVCTRSPWPPSRRRSPRGSEGACRTSAAAAAPCHPASDASGPPASASIQSTGSRRSAGAVAASIFAVVASALLVAREWQWSQSVSRSVIGVESSLTARETRGRCVVPIVIQRVVLGLGAARSPVPARLAPFDALFAGGGRDHEHRGRCRRPGSRS